MKLVRGMVNLALTQRLDKQRPRLLHIASSYPDAIGPDTSASSLLLECCPEFEHTVFSVKRAGWHGGIHRVPFQDPSGSTHEAVAYGAPGKGIFFRRTLDQLVDYIFERIQSRGLEPDLIHGHKLTTDGYVAFQLSKRLNIPFCISLQANTDVKIITARPDLKPIFRNIWQKASLSFAFAPVAEQAITSRLGTRTASCFNLPCPTSADRLIPPSISSHGGAKTILTAFHLSHYVNKNVERLMKAIAIARHQVPNIRLEVLGGGDPKSFLKLSKMASGFAEGLITLTGSLPHGAIQKRLNAATGFALLSRRESFGMIFAESLLAGTPVLHPSGRAIDGYFEEGQFSLSADPMNVAEIAEKLVRLCRDETSLKSRLIKAQTDGNLNFLQRDQISANYVAAIRSCLHP